MASTKNILSNPAFIGAATAIVTYVVVEELFDDVIEDFFDAIKGKKKDGNGGGKQKGGRGRGGGRGMPGMGGMGMGMPGMMGHGKMGGMKMMRNKWGNQFPVMDNASYFGAWERGY